jgi:hypothetical protein
MTPSLFNSLINIFSPICDITIDEGNYIMDKYKKVQDAILIKDEGFEKKQKQSSGFYEISKMYRQKDNVKNNIFFPKHIFNNEELEIKLNYEILNSELFPNLLQNNFKCKKVC